MSDFILISVQKSGTDMLSQALGIYTAKGHTQIDGMVAPEDDLPHPQVLKELSSPWRNGIARSHMPYSVKYAEAIKDRGAKAVFAYRDPRDTIVSWAHWIRDGHAAGWFNLGIPPGENIGIIIDEIIKVSDFHFSRFIGWLFTPHVFQVRYEKLVNYRRVVLDQLGLLLKKNPSKMEKRINPSTSITFRKGKIGEWRATFTEAQVKEFWRHNRKTMEIMGYG